MTDSTIKNTDFQKIGGLCGAMLEQNSTPRKCEICGKPFVPVTLSVLGAQKTVYAKNCNCYELKLQEKARKEREQKLREKYERANIGKRYIDITLEKLEALGTEHVADARKYVDEFNPEGGASLHLIGEFGNGKTSVGYATLRELLSRGFNGLYITWLDIVNRCYYAKSFNSQEKIEEILVDLCRFDIIVVDEFVINLKDDKEVNSQSEAQEILSSITS